MIFVIGILALYCAGTVLLEFIPALFMPDRKAWIKTGLFCNVITNPILNVIMLMLFAMVKSRVIVLISAVLLELMIVLFEAYIYKKNLNKPPKICLIFSFIANLFSVSVGFILNSLFIY